MFNWRAVTQLDIEALKILDARCHEADGEEAVPQEAFSDFNMNHTEQICAALAQDNGIDQVVAVGLTQLSGETLMVRGKVHPEFRRRGLGTHILSWAEQQASRYGLPRMLMIRNEAFNPDCEPLYRKSGYVRMHLSYFMRRNLDTDIPHIPSQFQHAAWNDQNASQFFQVYQNAFRERPGFPNMREDEWIAGYKQDDDFRHDLSFLALDGDQPIGFITAGVANFHQTPIGWIIQVGSHPDWRGRGAAAGLIAKVMRMLKAEGLPYVELHVNANNPGAKRVYEQLGFRVQGARVKYQKVLS